MGANWGEVSLVGSMYDDHTILGNVPGAKGYSGNEQQGVVWRLHYDRSTSVIAWDFIAFTGDWTQAATLPAVASVRVHAYGPLLGSPNALVDCPPGTFQDGGNCIACDPGYYCSGGPENNYDPCFESECCGACCMRLPRRAAGCLAAAAAAAGHVAHPAPPPPHPPAPPATDTYNPLYGADSWDAYCISCYTTYSILSGSDPGSATCTDGMRHPDCTITPDKGGVGLGMGSIWDEDQAVCVLCDPGTWRNTTDMSIEMCTAW